MSKTQRVSFDEWLGDHLVDKNDEYKEAIAREKFKMDLAVQIKNVRTQQKLSQRAFAKKVGLSQSTIANIELGKAAPNIDTMLEIARKNDKELKITYS